MTIREKLLATLRNNPGLNPVVLANMLGVTTRKISGPLSLLLSEGLIAREGKHGQHLYRLTNYGMCYAPDALSGVKLGKVKLVQRTDTNEIFQECRNSPAMKRVLSVYGVRA